MVVAYLRAMLGPVGMRYHIPNLLLGKSEQHMGQRKHLPGHLDTRQQRWREQSNSVIIDDLKLWVFQYGLLCWALGRLPFSYFG